VLRLVTFSSRAQGGISRLEGGEGKGLPGKVFKADLVLKPTKAESSYTLKPTQLFVEQKGGEGSQKDNSQKINLLRGLKEFVLPNNTFK
jgi:hypothetical protein